MVLSVLVARLPDQAVPFLTSKGPDTASPPSMRSRSSAASAVAGSMRLIQKGWSHNSARKTALLVCACCVVPVFLAPIVHDAWAAVIIVGVAAAAHQGWSASSIHSSPTSCRSRRLAPSSDSAASRRGSHRSSWRLRSDAFSRPTWDTSPSSPGHPPCTCFRWPLSSGSSRISTRQSGRVNLKMIATTTHHAMCMRI